MRRPRRIFRGTAYAAPGAAAGLALRGTVVIGLASALVGGAIMLRSHPVGLFATAPAAPPLSGTVSVEPNAVAVVDGGTLRLRDTVVRLAGVVAPGRGRICTDGLSGSYDCGTAATAALAGLVRGRAVSCQLDGPDGFGLAQGTCEAAGTDLGNAVVAAGWARTRAEEVPSGAPAAGAPAFGTAATGAMPKHRSGLGDAEAEARAARRGLWQNGAQPGF